MPYSIVDTKIRYIDPNNGEQLKELGDDLDPHAYLRQSPPHTLPKTIEPEFADKRYLSWAYERISRKYPSAQFKYAVLDHTYAPLSRFGRTITVPTSFISLFNYGSKSFAGPLFLGITPCMLQANGIGHPIAKQNLPEHLRSYYTARDQQRITQEAVQAVLTLPGISGLIIAIPNSRAFRGSRSNDQQPDLSKAAYYHVLTGGHTLDQYAASDFAKSDVSSPENKARFNVRNPLQCRPVSFTKMVRSDADTYTVFPLLDANDYGLLNDLQFCRICHDIRTLGPDYQLSHPERPPGIRATVQQGLEIMAEMARAGIENISAAA